MNYLLSEIARIVGGEHRGCDLRVKEVATDSRGVFSSDDMVFVAINGERIGSLCGLSLSKDHMSYQNLLSREGDNGLMRAA